MGSILSVQSLLFPLQAAPQLSFPSFADYISRSILLANWVWWDLGSELSLLQCAHHSQVSPAGAYRWHELPYVFVCHFASLMNLISSFVPYTINYSRQGCQDLNDIFQQYKTHQEVRFVFVCILLLSVHQQALSLLCEAMVGAHFYSLSSFVFPSIILLS